MMHPLSPASGQRGAVLVVGLIVLMLITLIVAAAFKFSTYNLKSVGNMQAHNEAIASANKAIEKLVGSSEFNTAPGTEVSTEEVDIDLDGKNDYTVTIPPPVCIKATKSASGGTPKTDILDKLEGTFEDLSKKPGYVLYNVIWEIDATASSSSSGSYVRIRQGISKSLTQEECNIACPPVAGGVCS